MGAYTLGVDGVLFLFLNLATKRTQSPLLKRKVDSVLHGVVQVN
jgi:hypothetical protein